MREEAISEKENAIKRIQDSESEKIHLRTTVSKLEQELSFSKEQVTDLKKKMEGEVKD